VRYIFLLYFDEAAAAAAGSPEQVEVSAAYGRVTQEMQQAGAFQAGDALQGSGTATVVRAGSNGSPLTTDGPFAETKEQLGGFYILDCANLDEAVEWAAKIPAAQYGSVEVRPILELP
jgi:hypothetical protein